MWLLDPIYDGEGELLRPGLLTLNTPPKGYRCPFGVTFDDAVAIDELHLFAEVRRGVLSEELALEVARRLGIKVETPS